MVLIGGAPGAGKTTLATALAAQFGTTSLTIDDLQTAAQAVTTPDSHPGLHVMDGMPFTEYFTTSSIDRLQADANAQHGAIWPLVERIIRKGATWGPSIVIEGWYLRPHLVAKLELDNVWATWIIVEPSVLEARERQNTSWLQDSPNPDRMLENFLARSLWFNELMHKEATAFGMKVLKQDGTATAEELCHRILEVVDEPERA